MISKSLEDTRKEAQKLVQTLKPKVEEATVIALSGNLGSGKTTFTKFFAKDLGISPDEITSPTFVIMKNYDLDQKNSAFKKFIHIDAYRLEKAEEIEKLGWRKLLADPGNLILIEWPENIDEIIPKNSQRLSFKFIDGDTREIIQ